MSAGSKKDKGGQVQLFIAKLHQILENPHLEDVVRWTADDDSFIIRNVSRFTDQVLPSYYKHHNFASFIRQLNIYSFKKVRHSEGDNVYAHPLFIRGKPQLLKSIVRKPKEEKEDVLALYQYPHAPEEQDKVRREISELKLKQKDLREMCRQFLYHNQKLLDQNQAVVQRMERDYKDKERRLEEFLIYLVAQKGYRALPDSDSALSLPTPTRHPQEDNQGTPLEVLANNLQRNDQFRKMKSLLENAFGGSPPNRRKNKNFTIVAQKQEEAPSPLKENHEEEPKIDQQVIEEEPFLAPPEDKSFLSFDALDYADGFDDFDLENSR